jgi:hypothetical protein
MTTESTIADYFFFSLPSSPSPAAMHPTFTCASSMRTKAPPQKVLLGDFTARLLLVVKEYDGEGTAHDAVARFYITITGITSAPTNSDIDCKVTLSNGNIHYLTVNYDQITTTGVIAGEIRYKNDFTISKLELVSTGVTPAINYGINGIAGTGIN